MLAALLLSLSLHSEPTPAVEHSAIERPGLELPAPDWAFIPLPSWMGPTTGAAALMFAVDIDPTEPVQSEERDDLDVYESEEP